MKFMFEELYNPRAAYFRYFDGGLLKEIWWQAWVPQAFNKDKYRNGYWVTKGRQIYRKPEKIMGVELRCMR